MPWFVLQNEDGSDGKTFEIGAGDTLMGRGLECRIILNDARVSRQHCHLSRQKGGVTIRNLSRTNGTWVNGALIDEVVLQDGDLIQVGGARLRYSTEPAVRGDGTDAEADSELKKSILFYGDALDFQNSEKVERIVNLTKSSAGLEIRSSEEKADTGDELEMYRRRFDIIRDVVESVVSELDLDKIFALILDHVFSSVHAERGCVLLYDAETDECVPCAVRERERRKLSEEFPMSRTICRMVLEEKVAVLSTNAMQDSRFSKEESIIYQGIRSVMSAPIVYKKTPLGIISVDSRDRDSVFSKQDLNTLSIIASLAATAIHNAQMVERQIRIERTRQNFERFLPPSLARRIAEEGREPQLGGERADVTVLFCDIRSFTSICEDMAPEAVVQLLNCFFREMTECVFRHQGTLDKYMGDAVLAVFGCPEVYEHHSFFAAQAALSMRTALREHPQLSRQIRAGISLHRGPAIHGFVGVQERMQYTVIGATVNIASRLCDIAKGNQILISKSVYDTAPERLIVKELEPVLLEGTTEMTHQYELVGIRDSPYRTLM